MALTVDTSNLQATRASQTVRWFSANNPAVITFDGSGSPASSYVQCKIVNEAGSTDLATLKPIALDTSLQAKIDLSPLLNALLDAEDDSITAQSGTISAAKTGKFLRFRLAYRDDITGGYTTPSTVYTAVQAVRQLGDVSTLATYIALGSGSPLNLDAVGAFLTGFDTIPIWYYNDGGTRKPWLPSIAFPIGENFAGNDFEVTGLGSAITGSALDEGVYYVGTNTDADLSSSAVFTIGLTDTTNTLDIIQSKNVQYREACINPVAVKWLNDLGGWDTWAFEGKAPISFDVENTSTYLKPFDSLGSATGYNRSFAKTTRESISAVAKDLTANEAEQLTRMLASPHVLLFTGNLTDATYSTWQTVEVQGGGYSSRDSFNPRNRIEFTFIFPEQQNTLG